MYFFSRLFRGVKWTLSAIGLVASGVIVVYGAIHTLPLVIGVGCASAIPGAFIFFENTKVVRDMEKYVNTFKNDLKVFETDLNKFKDENKKLNDSISELGLLRDSYVLEVEKLKTLLKSSEDQLDSLTSLKNSYIDENAKLKQNINIMDNNNQTFTKENRELKLTVDNLLNIRKEYEEQLLLLNGSLESLKVQYSVISEVKDKYVIENNKLLDNNQKFSDENNKLKNALASIEKLYIKSRELLQSFIETKSIYSDLSVNITQTADKIELTQHNLQDNVDKLTSLIDVAKQRNKDEFKLLDKNGDGVLTLDEFINPTNLSDEDTE